MSRSLKFLHLTTFYPPYSFGGDAMYIYRLAHALGDRGHEVDVVHCVDSYHLQHPAEPEIRFAEHPRVKRHELRSGLKWLSPLLTQQTGMPWLKRKPIENLLARKRYDLIHFHNISLLGPQVLAMAPINGSVPAKLYTTHEHWLVCPMHVLWKFGTRVCEKPACTRCTLMGKRPPQLWRSSNMLRDASRHVDLFVSPSRFTAKMHNDRGFSQPVEHLPYFIERADEDWRKPQPRPHERPFFLFVGRLEKYKGLQSLIEVWGPTIDADLLVAGSGSYEHELRSQAGDKPNVRFLGSLPQAELGSYYFHCLATIVPSVTYETFGIIVVEAFARKAPVIVRDLGALPEVVRDSEGGLIFDTGEELIDSIMKLRASPDLRDQLGADGYMAFEKYWTPEAHLRQYFGIVDRLTAVS